MSNREAWNQQLVNETPRKGLRIALAVDRLVLLDRTNDLAIDSPVQIVFLPVKLQERQLWQQQKLVSSR